jgi:hypothetical protein
MHNQYKLIIKDNIKILKEDASQYSVRDLKSFVTDIYQIVSKTTEATIRSFSAQLEYIILATKTMGFADMKSLNEDFEQKLKKASELYDASIPEKLKDDVDTLLTFSNPGVFMLQKATNALNEKDNLLSSAPFYKFAKDLVSGEYFKTNVENWGKKGLFGIPFNNIIWYKGFVYKDLLYNNIKYLQKYVDEGGLSSSDLKITDMNDLKRKMPIVWYGIKSADVFEIYHRGTFTFYDFCKNANNTMLGYMEREIKHRLLEEPAAGTPDWTRWNNEQTTLREEKERILNDFMSSCSNNLSQLNNQVPDAYRLITEAINGRPEEFEMSVLFGTLLGAAGTVDRFVQTATAPIGAAANTWTALSHPLQFLGSLVGINPPPSPSGIPAFFLQLRDAINDFFLIESNSKLLFKGNKKMLLENEDKQEQKSKKRNISFVDEQNEMINELIPDSDKSKKLKEWKEFILRVKSINPNDNQNKKNKLILEMMEYSLKFFDQVFDELKGKLKLIEDESNEFTQNFNKKIEKKFGFETTPKGFATKQNFDFELICENSRLTSVSHIMNIEIILEELNILKNLLMNIEKNDNKNINLLINQFKNKLIEKEKIINDNATLKKFNSVYAQIKKEFGEKSKTLENFENNIKNSRNNFNNLKKQSFQFCDNINNIVEKRVEIKTEAEIINLLKSIITNIEQNSKNMNEKIYSNLLPSLEKNKNYFEKDLKDMKNNLNEKFGEIAEKINIESFDKIYNENIQKFYYAYNQCMKILKAIDSKNILNDILQNLNNKISNYDNNLNKNEKDQLIKQKDVNNKDEDIATLSISNDQKSLTPITVKSNEE